MHKFKAFLKQLPNTKAREEFAARCDTTLGQLIQVARGRKPGESLTINIERESAGAITCEELRPDVDWAYLRQTKAKKKKAA